MSYGNRADCYGDGEPAALGGRRADGTCSHAGTGDGLTVFQEYRGYEVDGGADFTAARHVRLSPALKELLVQVNEQDGMAGDVGTGPAANPSAFAAFNKTQVMQNVAQFYCHPTRGAGIDLYWVNRPFVPLTGPAIMGRPDAYRYTGDMVYTPKPGTTVAGDLNGATWISSDMAYRLSGIPLSEYKSVFPDVDGCYQFMMQQNRDASLPKFVMLLFLSRYAYFERQNNNAPYEVRPRTQNAFSILENNTDSKVSQGSVVHLAAMSEECPFDPYKGNLGHYTVAEFLEVVGYSVAHEIFHLLCGVVHNTNPNTVFGVGPNLSTLVAPADELSQINLKLRRGVTP